METYVINLNKRSDRLKIFTNLATNAEVDFERMEAVDGKLIDRKKFWTTKFGDRYLKRGELAVYLSHCQIYEETTKSIAMIFEDDARIPLDFYYQLKGILDKLPNDWDMLLLGTSNLWRRKYQTMQKIIYDDGIFQKFEGDIYGLHSYIINRRGMDRMLDCKYPIDSPIDVKINNVGLNVYVLKEDLVTTNKLGSDTQ